MPRSPAVRARVPAGRALHGRRLPNRLRALQYVHPRVHGQQVPAALRLGDVVRDDVLYRGLSGDVRLGHEVRSLVHADGRWLLIRQSYRNHWGLPGGLLQRHESPADACRREVLEEVGLPVELVGEGFE